MEKLKVSIPVALLVLVAATFAAWFAVFPLRDSLEVEDVILESAYLAIVGLVGLAVVLVHREVLLLAGWSLFSYALLLDLLDEFTREPDWISTTAQAAMEIGGLVLVVAGLHREQRRLRRELAALARGQARFELLGNNIDEVFWLSTPDESELIYVSPPYEAVTGRPARSLVEDPASWRDCLHPDDRARLAADADAAAPARGDFSHELRIARPDGTTRWLWLRSRPVTDGDGTVVARKGVAIDVTERHEAEELLRLQQEVLAQIASGLEATAVLETLCRVVEQMVPGTLCSVLVHDECTGTLRFRAGPSLPPDLRETLNGLVPGDRAASCGTAFHLGRPVFVTDVTADERWAAYRELAAKFELAACWSYPFMGDDDAPVGTFAITHHQPAAPGPFQERLLATGANLGGIALQRERRLRALRASEAALRASEERYALATAAARVGVWDWNVETGEFFLDRNVKAILGYDDEAIPNDLDAWMTHVHPDDRDDVAAAVAGHLAGGTPEFVHEHRMIHKDGSVRWILVRGQTIRDEQGQRRLVGTDFDITELKNGEERQRLMMRELDHRVRNHLLSLDSLIDLISRSGPDVDAFSRSIKGRVQAMSAVHDMLSGSRWTPVALSRLFEVLAPLEQPGALHPSGPDVFVPPAQSTALGMVLNELLANSVKHGALGAPGGRVDVTWSVEPDGADADRCRFRWRETGGPPVSSRGGPGVGTQLITGLIRSDLRGRVEFAYPPSGADHGFEIVLDRRDEESKSQRHEGTKARRHEGVGAERRPIR